MDNVSSIVDFVLGAVERYIAARAVMPPENFGETLLHHQDAIEQTLLKQKVLCYSSGGRTEVVSVQSDSTAQHKLNVLLTAMSRVRLDPVGILRPLLAAPTIKLYNDAILSKEIIVLMQDLGSKAHIDLGVTIKDLLVQAQGQPGAIDAGLAQLHDQGIEWNPRESNGSINTTLSVEVRPVVWVAVIDVDHIAAKVASLLVRATLVKDSSVKPWVDAARVHHDLPKEVLPLVSGILTSMVFPKTKLAKVRLWGASLPCWLEEPLRFSQVTVQDLFDKKFV